MSAPTLLIGLDVGGSTTHLRGEYAGSSDQSILIDRRGPGANPNRRGREAAIRTLEALITDALPSPVASGRLVLCAGVAGAGRADEQATLADALHTALAEAASTVRVEVVHDGLIALDAAYNAASGTVVIAGTGSLVLARTEEDTLRRAGGWGPVLGDAGSGHALGRAGLRAVAAAFDGGPSTRLRASLHEAFDIESRDELFRAVYQDDIDVAAVAPLVMDTAGDGDAVAAALVTEATETLAQQVGWIARHEDALASRLTLVGGLVQHVVYSTALRRALDNHVPDWSVKTLEAAPVAGALRRARRLADEADS